MPVTITTTDNSKQGIAWSLDADLDGDITKKDVQFNLRSYHISIAQLALEEEQAAGFDKSPRVRTDNVWEKPPAAVKLFGKIEYYARTELKAALLDAYNILVSRSPLDTGVYIDHHWVYVNGVSVARNYDQLSSYLTANAESLAKPGTYITIVNVTPYAARLEWNGYRREIRGSKKGLNRKKKRWGKSRSSGRSIRIPNGAYVLAERAIRFKYKQAVNVKFGFIRDGYSSIKIPSIPGFRRTYIDRNKNGYKGSYVYPSLTFTVNQLGVLQ